ncbi:MAG TPA: hypothetical protein VGD68_03995, partial [Streptosporangiaceae bacterium]
MDDEKKIEILLAEYNSLRTESIESVKNKFQVLTFGFGGLAVFVGSALSARVSIGVSVLILFIIVPSLSKAIVIVWLGEHRRMVRAGGGVAALEIRINQIAGENLLGWERWVRSESRAMSLPYRTTLGIFQFASVASIAVGGLVLWRYLDERNSSPSAFIALIVGLVAVAALELFLHMIIDRRWKAAVGSANVAEERLRAMRL